MSKYRCVLSTVIVATMGMTWIFWEWFEVSLAATLPLAASLVVLVTCAMGLLRPRSRQRGILLVSLCIMLVFQSFYLLLVHAGRGLLPPGQVFQYRLRVGLVVTCSAIYLIAIYVVVRSRKWVPVGSPGQASPQAPETD